ncbi:MAG TPA: FGGY-family carbohydrate kinase, partial [Polyangiaceae bacterium]|nr:FGGY-family carbohydrate kinase [Polyangiaceae bacterium]
VAFGRASSDVGAPHWDLAPERRAADVLAEMPPEAGRSAKEGTQIGCIRVDGGAAQNNLLMQFQGDVFEVGSQRPCDAESASRGAALLVDVGAGVFRSVQEAA